MRSARTAHHLAAPIASLFPIMDIIGPLHIMFRIMDITGRGAGPISEVLGVGRRRCLCAAEKNELGCFHSLCFQPRGKSASAAVSLRLHSHEEESVSLRPHTNRKQSHRTGHAFRWRVRAPDKALRIAERAW